MEGYGNENPGAFQSTRPLRGATALLGINAVVLSISTHAPLAGRDTSTLPSCSTPAEFQPTRPLRGATSVRRFAGLRLKHFNPRAPCGARPGLSRRITTNRHFNPRAPCGARQLPRGTCQRIPGFQPTRPLRGATAAPLTARFTPHTFQPTRPLRGATQRGGRAA